jgi:hypothetical protein
VTETKCCMRGQERNEVVSAVLSTVRGLQAMFWWRRPSRPKDGTSTGRANLGQWLDGDGILILGFGGEGAPEPMDSNGWG